MDKLNTSERAQDARLRRIYKKTLADKRREITDQGEGCAICGRPFPKFTANQDHDHRCCPRRLKEYCGRCNRGWLCFLCNKYVVGVLEKMKVDIDKLSAYVKKWEPILRERGCYEPKEKASKLRRKR